MYLFNMKSLLSFFFLLAIKYSSKLFYKFEIGWPKEPIPWDKLRFIVFLNHTSLYEFLYVGILPNHFLRRMSKRMVAPAADKTMKRPLVGLFFKLFNPGIMPITRKRDETWTSFLENIYDDSLILIAPEGRMKRETGMDSSGNKMNVRTGITDILAGLKEGKMIFAYSGGLHHVQVPDKGMFPKLFKTLKMNIELLDIQNYKKACISAINTDAWRQQIINDIHLRMENNVPKWN
jgi:hypothetical protein